VSDAQQIAEQIASEHLNCSARETLANDIARALTEATATAEADAASHLERANQEIARRERAEIAYTQSEQKRLVLIDRAETAEAHLTEARRQVWEEAAKVADRWANSGSCRQHDDNPCCHVRTGAAIAEAIRDMAQTEAPRP
jgi:hypothetical protein